MVKLQFENKQQFKITLPKSIVLAKGWEKGDSIEILLDEKNNIILKKKGSK
jgi:bifunctional DNA-binding transcriptional regulator/antitoxin component of YhaV-PrlF toxin-antitoxin module